MKDKELEKILNEVAKETGINVKVVIAVYKHFMNYIYKNMTKVKLRYMNKDFIRANAININIPGFGRLLNKYGKTYKKVKNGKD